jgi:hypothetical protein
VFIEKIRARNSSITSKTQPLAPKQKILGLRPCYKSQGQQKANVECLQRKRNTTTIEKEESNQSLVRSLRLFRKAYHKDQTKQRTKNSYNKIGRPQFTRPYSGKPQFVPGKQVPKPKENGSDWKKRPDNPQNDQKNTYVN